jgi:hypothetical protein
MARSGGRGDPLGAITRHLDKTDDPALLILRVHLLVEERLREVVARVCRVPEELRAARLSFYQVLCICRAVVGRHDEPAWDFVMRLNEVRNRMAHHLDPGNLDELVGSVVAKLGAARHGGPATPVGRFREAAVYVCGYFDAIRGSVRLREGYGPEGEFRSRRPRSERRK